MKSIKFYSIDVKAIVTKKSSVTFCEEKKCDDKNLSCNFDENES